MAPPLHSAQALGFFGSFDPPSISTIQHSQVPIP